MPVKHATEAHKGDVISCDIWNEEHSITNLIPDATDTYQIGDQTNRWQSLYVNQIIIKNPPPAENTFAVYASTSDSYPRFRISQLGYVGWGGGSTVPDVELYRYSANYLYTPDSFSCGSLRVGGQEIITSDYTLKNINSIDQSLIPSSNDTYNLGSTTYRWSTIYCGGIDINSTIAKVKLENTSTSLGYPYIEFKNPVIDYKCGLIVANSSNFYLPYDATNSCIRQMFRNDTTSGSEQVAWYNSNGIKKLYLTLEGNLYIDGNYNTFSPELPDNWQEIDYRNYLHTQLNKEHPPRDEKGRLICICGKSGVCPEHQVQFEQKYAFDVSTTTAVTAKLVISLMDKITELENKISQLEEQLN